jgi:hypothetical protein
MGHAHGHSDDSVSLSRLLRKDKDKQVKPTHLMSSSESSAKSVSKAGLLKLITLFKLNILLTVHHSKSVQ